jgi:hypothetical protein
MTNVEAHAADVIMTYVAACRDKGVLRCCCVYHLLTSHLHHVAAYTGPSGSGGCKAHVLHHLLLPYIGAVASFATLFIQPPIHLSSFATKTPPGTATRNVI